MFEVFGQLGEAALGELVRLLGDADEEVRDAVVRAMIRVGAKSVPKLTTALSAPTPLPILARIRTSAPKKIALSFL